MTKYVIQAFLFLNIFSLKLFASSKYNSFTVVSQKESDGIVFKVNVLPTSNLVLNYSAPWQLEIVSNNLEFPSSMLKQADFDTKANRFQFKSKQTTHENGVLTLKIVSFACTADKSRCYREVVDLTHNWPGESTLRADSR